MNEAAFYQRVNHMQRSDAEKITEEQHLHWRLDGRDTLLDIGCGSGDVLMDFVYPLLPKEFSLLLGTDISSKMVDYAKHKYTIDERVKFRVLDIESDALPNELCEQFDHVTSFYCLHWVQNQRLALRNINRLIRRNGGDCLLIYLASTPLFDIYKAFSQLPKWAPYMKDVDSFISPLHFAKDPCQEVRNMLIEAGFVDYEVNLKNRVHTFKNGDLLKSSVKAVCPFMDRLTIEQQQEFLNDLLKCVEKTQYSEYDAITKETKYQTKYKLMVVYAKKSEDYFASNIEKDKVIKNLN